MDLPARRTAFLLGCIPTRLAVVVAAMRAPPALLKALAALAAAVSLGFLAIFLGGWRKSGRETGGAPIWWDLLRPVHAALWGLAAVSAWQGRRDVAWRALLADACLGLVSFSVYHGRAGAA